MLKDITRSRLIQVWFAAVALVVVAGVAFGATMTVSTGAMLLALSLVPLPSCSCSGPESNPSRLQMRCMAAIGARDCKQHRAPNGSSLSELLCPLHLGLSPSPGSSLCALFAASASGVFVGWSFVALLAIAFAAPGSVPEESSQGEHQLTLNH